MIGHTSIRLFALTFASVMALGIFAASPRTVVPMTEWRFRYCGGCDANTPVVEPNGCFRAEYDDSRWKSVVVPHDWGVESAFDRKYGCWTGALPCFGVGWYRARFKTPTIPKECRAALEFDGVMSDSSIYVNGACVGARPYGYASFSIDVTPFLSPRGEENVVAVRVDNALWSARWYPGGGIYRSVRLVVTGRSRIAWNGVHVMPALSPDGCGTVTINVDLDGVGKCDVRKTILGEKGLVIRSPRLWDIETPNLYTARVELVEGGHVVDAVESVFGFRKAEFRPKEGFFLNGRHMKINGVCLHHDLGALGAAVDSAAIRRQLRIMKEMGANAVRTSHNPPSCEFLDECDRMGIMVLDEAFDEWLMPKNRSGYSRFFSEWWTRDVVDWVRRDRNHPCIVAWSVGNEVCEQKNPRVGRMVAKNLVAAVKREDQSRPVTIGCDSMDVFTNGLMEAMDIYGANYRPNHYGELLEFFPEKGVLGTETASMVSSRDTYFYPLPEGFENRPRPFAGGYLEKQVSSYDIFTQRSNNYHPDFEFFWQDRIPQVYGEFVWTGFDYLGEPAPYGSSRSSYYGAVDICGFPKDRYYAYQAQWRPDHQMVHILPHWTWPGREGAVTPVWAYTSGDEAELFVNGVSHGRRKKNRKDGVYTLEWNSVRYESGEIRVVAYKDGIVWAQANRRTAGPVAALCVESEKGGRGDGLVYYRIALVDSVGVVVPNDDRKIRISVEGEGTLAGACNGDATDMTGFRSASQHTFRGLCQAIVRRTPGASCRIVIECDGLSRRIESVPCAMD